MKRALFPVGLAVLLPVLGGCAGYRLGSTLPPGIRTIYVATFVNATREPRLETATTSATLQELHRDGTLEVTDAARADSVLEVTLVSYSLEPLRYRKDREKTTREYRLWLTADIHFKKTQDNSTLLTRRVRGWATFELEGDLSVAKRRALPKASRDLAHEIVESVVEYW